MKLATTTGDFRGYVSGPAEAVRCYAGTGFKLLDFSFWSDIYPNSPFLGKDWKRWVSETGEAADKLGLKFVQAHAPQGDPFAQGQEHEIYLEATRRAIEGCALVGIPHIVVHAGSAEGLTKADFFRRNKAFYETLFPVMEKTGVSVLFENSSEQLRGTQYYFMGAPEMREFIDYVRHPLLHVCWDTGHANMRSMDQYEALVTLGDELKALHIQDNFGKTDDHIAPFQGTGNFDRIMQGLIDIGYQGHFTFEAIQILTRGGAWPNARPGWEHNGQPVTRLLHPSLELKRKAVSLLYDIGKFMLTQYGCYEY